MCRIRRLQGTWRRIASSSRDGRFPFRNSPGSRSQATPGFGSPRSWCCDLHQHPQRDSPRQNRTCPIEQIQVGDRVLAESPTGEEDIAFGSEIIPSDWRKLTLRAPKRDGTVADVVLLRPLTWLKEQHGEVGGTVFISVPECGIDGNAEVLAIDPCPEIPSGAGRVVTGTFLHQARSTITLTIGGQSEPIECTGNRTPQPL